MSRKVGFTPEPECSHCGGIHYGTPLGMDFWWDKWMAECVGENPVMPPALTKFWACQFAQWFAEQCAEAGEQYVATSAAVPQAPAVNQELLEALEMCVKGLRDVKANSVFRKWNEIAESAIAKARAAAVPAPGRDAQRNEFIRLFEDDLAYYEQRHKHKSWIIMEALKRAEDVFGADSGATPKEG